MTPERRAAAPRGRQTPTRTRTTTRPRVRTAARRGTPTRSRVAEVLPPVPPPEPLPPVAPYHPGFPMPVEEGPTPTVVADEPPYRSAPVRFLALMGVIFALTILISATTTGTWWLLLYDFAFFLVPCAAAVALVGLARRPMGPVVRVVITALVGGSVLFSLALGGAFRFVAVNYFLMFFPVWGAIALLGAGRYRLGALQAAGATLALISVWRPVYLSFPDLTQVLSATGTIEPYSLVQLWEIVIRKFYHEVLFAAVGLFLLYRRFPFVQKPPQWPGDVQKVLAHVHAGIRRNVWIDTGLGCTAFLLALVGSIALATFLGGLDGVPAGADDSRVFERITPELVLLLSLAAGLGEEIVFRALIQPYFERGFLRAFGRPLLATALAILSQALLFGIVHSGYSNLSHVLLPFGFGLLAGLVFRYWGFIAVVYAHTMIDVFAFGFDAAENGFEWMSWVLVVLFFANLAVGLLVPIYMLVDKISRRRGRRMQELPASMPA